MSRYSKSIEKVVIRRAFQSSPNSAHGLPDIVRKQEPSVHISTYAHAYSWNLENIYIFIFWKHFYHEIAMVDKSFALYWCLWKLCSTFWGSTFLSGKIIINNNNNFLRMVFQSNYINIWKKIYFKNIVHF